MSDIQDTEIPEPTPKKTINAFTVQTAENNSFHEYVPPKSQIKDPNPSRDPDLTFNGFIGMTKDNIRVINRLLGQWREFIIMEGLLHVSPQEREQAGVSDSEIKATIERWSTVTEERFPGKTEEEITSYMSRLFATITQIANPNLGLTSVPTESGLTNQFNRTSDIAHRTSDITPLIPTGRNRGKLPLSEYMFRQANQAARDGFKHDILLRNSYLAISIDRPGYIDMGVLVNDIARSIVGHVRSVHRNIPVLSNIAAIRVIWDFVKNRIYRHSMKDVNDFDELAQVIPITDMDVIGANLLCLAFPNGIDYTLHCLGEDMQCGWHDTQTIDPSLLVIDRKHLDTPEQSAAYANMVNYSRSYSREESMALSKDTDYGIKMEPVYAPDGKSHFIIKPPVLTDSFAALEVYEDFISSELNRIREDSLTAEAADKNVSDFLNGIIGTDYLHFVAEYRIEPKEIGEPPEVIRRSDEDPKEFYLGIIRIIENNPTLGKALIEEVIRTYPFMTKSFIGMDNAICPKCSNKLNLSSKQATEEGAEPKDTLGYTPINVISTFFTLVSQMRSGRQRVGEKVVEEVLSKIMQ